MELTRNGFPRIVVTGMAAITALGGPDEYWESLKAGKSGIRFLDHFDGTHLNVQIASYVTGFDSSAYVDKKEARRVGRCGEFTISVTKMLLADAGLTEDDLARDSERSGVSLGSGLAAFDVIEEATYEFKTGNKVKPSPFALASGLGNMQAHYVSRETKSVGPIWPIPTACAAGSQAFVQAIDLIRSGKVDRVFTGGVDSTMHEYALAGFDAMKAVARGYNDAPEKASRPFDLNRNGFVYGEAAGLFVVETLEKALARDAHIYAEVLGGAVSSDAYHIAALDPEAQGMTRSMANALLSAGLNPDEVDYINAHGTSTQLNDRLETLAIKKVFGERAYQIPINSTKSMIGHCQGAAGAIEALVCMKSLNEGVLHATINYETPDPECDLDYIPNEARDVKIKVALSNNFGLGGINASVVFGAI